MHGTPATWVPLAGAAHDVALEVLRHGPLSRSELARRLDLSPQSLTRLAKPLLDTGLLMEIDSRHAAESRRPTRPLDVVAGSHHFVGVKLTGDTAHAVLTTMRAEVVGQLSRRLGGTAPDAAVGTVKELVTTLQRTGPAATAVGISLGGQISDLNTVERAPFLGWTGVPLGRLIEAAVGLPTVVDNDLLSLTRAEQWFGTARDCGHFAVITVGDGVGYGLVVHDQLVTSADAGIGLVGHFPLDPLGPLCPEGHQGCATAMLTIPGITGRISVGLGRSVPYQECLDLCGAGDPVAVQAVTASARALGRLVAAVGNLTMPEKILVTGEGVGLALVARPALDAAISEHRDPYADPLDVQIHQLGYPQWARGAAATAIQSFVLGSGQVRRIRHTFR